MNDNSLDLDQIDKESLIDDVSDEALEAAGMGELPRALPCTFAPFLAPTFGTTPC